MVGNQLNTVIEAVPEPMLHLDAAGLIVASNAAARSLLGDWIQGRSYAARAAPARASGPDRDGAGGRQPR